MLHPLDIAIIVLYLAATVAIGIVSRGRQDTAEDYFTTGGGMRSWFATLLVGLSIAASFFSGISFLAYPSFVYSYGIVLALGIPAFLMVWPILHFWFLPRYLKAGHRHPYQVIEDRLGPTARTIAAFMFIMLRIGWLASLIYAPVIAVMGAANLGPQWFWPLILIIGLSSTLYTVVGGIRGVIVTDALQFAVLLCGIALTVIYVLIHLPVPLHTAIAGLRRTHHLGPFDWSIVPTHAFTVWAVIIGCLVANGSSYMADQMCLQRYLASGSVREASRSFAINVIGAMIVAILLLLVGLAVTAWYQFAPDPHLPANADQIFPYFVATHLPTGLVGLILAAILAATMSSMTAGINALAGTLTLDIAGRFQKSMTPQRQLRFARTTSLVLGVLATIAAGFVSHLGDIFDIAQKLLGVFLGPLLACMLLAMLPWRVRRVGVIVGMLLGTVVGWVVALSHIASLWVGPATFAVALLVPLVFQIGSPAGGVKEEVSQ